MLRIVGIAISESLAIFEKALCFIYIRNLFLGGSGGGVTEEGRSRQGVQRRGKKKVRLEVPRRGENKGGLRCEERQEERELRRGKELEGLECIKRQGN